MERLLALALVPPFLACSAATAYVVSLYELCRWVRR